MQADAEKLADLAEQRILAPRWPSSTYRLQFNGAFTFKQAAAVVPYLRDLGITHCYASPYLKARPGSMHGYDISDHNSLNPEIGSWDDYLGFVRTLRKAGMGHIVDFVPNHMGIFDNFWWTDVLENGPGSPYAGFFDIDWDPVKPELRNKVLLPILEDQYGEVLQSGQLRLELEQGGFRIIYHDHMLPIDPKTSVQILEPFLSSLSDAMDPSDPDRVEIESIITACRNLPDRENREPEAVSERQREKEVIKRRLSQICDGHAQVRAALNRELNTFNGVPGDNASYDSLHALLESQAYRLSYWRVASDEVNYRRFFDVNELVALRMDKPSVFEQCHVLLREMVREGLIDGIRIDHVDGLMDPAGYLWQLQRACFVEQAFKAIQTQSGGDETDSEAVSDLLSGRFEVRQNESPDHASTTFFYLLVEKILGEKEYLRETWPTAGTTGYEFAVGLNGVFVDQRNARSMLNTYRRFTGSAQTFRDVVYHSKSLLMTTSMSAEVNVIAHALDRISERSRWYRDFTLSSQRDAIREVIACFPVYRSYISAFQESIDKRDKAVIDAAVAEAKRRNPAISASLFDFIRNTLLLQYPPDMSEEARDEQRYFVMRFQQHSGPVMAKGLEDTAFYIYNPLVSLNEVGGNPERFGNRVDQFHEQNTYRLNTLPYSMISTSTHDSKRSEDVRARIDVLSEIPREWRSALRRWSQLNEKHRRSLNGDTVPDRNEEYLLYQTMLGTYPAEEVDRDEYEQYCGRIRDYMLKALREAKVHTSWVSPNGDYEEYVTRFVTGTLEKSPSNPFLADFAALNKTVTTCGMYNSLSQTLLRTFSPGVPDLYQGNELWNYSLVDPDNRRSVDFVQRQTMLRSLRKDLTRKRDLRHLAASLMDSMEDGRIKLFVTWRSLTYRRDHATLFSDGSYIPLVGTGPLMDHVCAFAWQDASSTLVVVAPRLCAKLTANASALPVGTSAWGDSKVVLPARLGGIAYTNIFTGESVRAVRGKRRSSLPLARIFSLFPVAALVSHGTRR
jgi:(1->4)-alpha-D-glucan 1-alpha-D-glucosylmutase